MFSNTNTNINIDTNTDSSTLSTISTTLSTLTLSIPTTTFIPTSTPSTPTSTSTSTSTPSSTSTSIPTSTSTSIPSTPTSTTFDDNSIITSAKIESNVNMCRYASEVEDAQHIEAVHLLNEIHTLIEDSKMSLHSLMFQHFKKVSTPQGLQKAINIIGIMVLNIRACKKRNKVSNTKHPKMVASYNKSWNVFIGIVATDSLLQQLLQIDNKFRLISKRIPTIRVRPDFVNAVLGCNIGQGGFILHTQGLKQLGGGRTEFDSAVDCLNAMKACMDGSITWDDIINNSRLEHETTSRPKELGEIEFKIQNEILHFVLKIRFPGTNYWEQSNSSRLRHILCGGNPPKVEKGKKNMDETNIHFSILYPHYAEFLVLVKSKIIQIIQNSHANPDCIYTMIPCCRITPVCYANNLCIKHTPSASKSLICGECRMDLCLGGCGRIYHGNTPCNISLDEASEAEINRSTKICPNVRCSIRISKTEGCNHMTCRNCRTEFCWMCGDELPRDERGHYSTEMHFNPGQFGVGLAGGCRQFNV